MLTYVWSNTIIKADSVYLLEHHVALQVNTNISEEEHIDSDTSTQKMETVCSSEYVGIYLQVHAELKLKRPTSTSSTS